MSNEDLLDKDFNYYLDKQDELVRKYNGKILIIQNQKVVIAFDDYDDAFFYASSNLKAGTYLLQKCSMGENDYTQTFHSRVSF